MIDRFSSNLNPPFSGNCDHKWMSVGKLVNLCTERKIGLNRKG